MKKFIVAAFLVASPGMVGQVLGVGNFIHVVADLDRAIEFYHDGLGLEMTGPPGPRAFSANAVVSSLYDAPGAQSRVASFRLPQSDMALEIVEFQGLNATPVKARFFDPGAITLTLPVENLEAVKTQLYPIKGLEWVSAIRNLEATVRGPDGIFVRLVTRGGPPLAPAEVAAAYTQVGLTVVVADADRAAQFYGDALGFTGRTGRLPARVTEARMQVPGDGFPVYFSDLDYADAKAVHSAIHDPGSGVLRLRVSDFEAAVEALKAQGATVVSAGGEPVNLGRNRAVILRDVNNLFLQILESAPAAAARN